MIGDGQGHDHLVLLFRANLMKRREVEATAVMQRVMDRVMIIWFSFSGLT